MACFQPGTLIDLGNHEAVSLDDVRGATLRLLRGKVWLTQHEDPQDIVLRDGDNWVVERNGRTVLEAQEDALVCVVGRKIKPVAGAWTDSVRAAGWRDWIADWVDQERSFVPYV